MSNNLGSKRGQEPDFSNCDSQDTTSVCEPCEKAFKCLTHVEFKNLQDSQEYLWKTGVGDLSKESGLQIIGFQGDEGSYDPSFKLKCLVKDSECVGKQGPFPTQCANIYFYEKDTSEEPQIMGALEQKGQDELLELKFNADYLDQDKKLIPHYLVAKEINKEEAESDGNSGLLFDIDTKGEALYLKEFTFTVQKGDGAKLINVGTDLDAAETLGTAMIMGHQVLSSMQGNALTKFLRRGLSFGILSKLDYMPASAFHVAVMNCECGDMSILDKEYPKLYKFFDDAVATTYVAPNYELKHNVTIKFDEISGSFNAENLLKALKKLEITLDMQEKFNGVDGAKANLVIKDPIEVLKKVFKKSYVIITILIDILKGTPKFIEEYFPEPDKKKTKIGNRALFDEIITFEVGLPNISLSGTSKLKIEEGKAKIQREDVKLTAKYKWSFKV